MRSEVEARAAWIRANWPVPQWGWDALPDEEKAAWMADEPKPVRRAREVIDHWRTCADQADETDRKQGRRTYVPASDGLRLAASRLEAALDGADDYLDPIRTAPDGAT